MNSLQILAIADRISAMGEQSWYQGVGIIVVFSCLIFLALILTVSGKIAANLNQKAKDKALAAKAATAPAAAPVVPVAPAATDDLSPELIAVISTAVHTVMGGTSHRILDIRQSAVSPYSISGRTEIFASHRINPVRRG